MTENWRTYVIVILMILSVVDLSLTYLYIYKYKQWQPDKPYNLMENNPLLVFLWNNLGFIIGSIVGMSIILSLMFIIGKSAHPIIIGIVFIFLTYALFTHYVNIELLSKLIIKYPSGSLPKEIIGEIVK